VTGGAGFVGSNLCRRLLDEGVEAVTVVDNLLSAERWNLPEDPRLRFVEGSAADGATLAALRDEDCEFVFHLATFHGNQNSIADPLADHANNALPTLVLLERLAGIKALRKVVYASAGCSLGQPVAGQATVSREDALLPLLFDSPYQVSKVLGELYGNYYFSRRGLPFVKARFQNVYGPGEILGAGVWRGTSATVWRNVVPTFTYRALQGMPLLVEGELASRDFIFVEDIVDGLLRCASHGAAGEVYNLGTGVETRIVELALTINRLAGARSEVHIVPGRDWDHSLRRYASTEKALQQLGFVARTAADQGLQRTVDWTRANLDRIRKAIARHAAFLREPWS
jgi:nucleoside-diphosphate-sugar epimerase